MSPADLFAAAVLLVALDCPRFDTRQAADAGLRTMGSRVAPALVAAEKSGTLERRRRVASMVRRFDPVDQVTPLLVKHYPLPMIEAAPDVMPNRDAILNTHLIAALALTNNPDDSSTATGLWVREMAAAGVPIATLDGLLVRMRARVGDRANAWWTELPPEPCTLLERWILDLWRWLGGEELLPFPHAG